MQSKGLKGTFIPIRNYEVACYAHKNTIICENCYATTVPPGDRILYSCFIMRTTESNLDVSTNRSCEICNKKITGKTLPIIEITKGDKNILLLDHSAANIYIHSENKYSQKIINEKNKKLLNYAHLRIRKQSIPQKEVISLVESSESDHELDESEINEILQKELRKIPPDSMNTIENVLLNFVTPQSK